MGTCDPNCLFNLSNKGNQEDDQPKTCGLPDCRAEAGGSRPVNHGQKDAPKEPKCCNMRGCRDGEACAKGEVICLFSQPGTSEDKRSKGPGGLTDGRNEAGGSRPVDHGQKQAPKARSPCNMQECQDGETCAKGTVNCLYDKPGTSTENEMSSCGLPGCQAKSSNKSNQDGDKFKGTCGLPDCRNKAAAGSRSRRNSRRSEGSVRISQDSAGAGAVGPVEEKRASGSKDQKSCNIPGCMDEEARAMGKEVCLYRQQPSETRVWGKIGCACRTLCKIWQQIQSDPYYWSLFKSIIFFVMGLSLYGDMAAGANPPPASLPKCRKPKS